MFELMDEMSELVYVADLDTYELLFVNKEGRKMFGISELNGQKCYKALQGLDHPCPFCTNKAWLLIRRTHGSIPIQLRAAITCLRISWSSGRAGAYGWKLRSTLQTISRSKSTFRTRLMRSIWLWSV